MASKVEPYFDEIVALVAGGLSIPKALASKPEFPKMQTFKWYAYHADHPERALRVAEAQAMRSTAARSERYADEIIALVESGKTIGEALASNPNYPSRSKFRLYTLKHPEIEQRLDAAQRKRSIAAPVFDAVVHDVSLGKSVTRALAELPQQISRTALRRLVINDPARAKALRLARYSASRIVRDRQATPRTPPLVRLDKRDHQFDRALYSNELYLMVDAAVPKHIESTIREDVVADIIVAILSEEITADEIGAKVKKLSAGYFKADRFRNQSLHAPAIPGSRVTIAETACPDLSEWRC